MLSQDAKTFITGGTKATSRATVVGVFALALLTACGGGGGGSSTAPGGGVPPTTAPTAPPPVTSARGQIFDIGNQRYAGDGAAAGAPVAGATVVVGQTLIVGATPPASLPQGDVAATTDAGGNCT